jgi:hypothetical protein
MRLALYVCIKNIGDYMGSHNGSIDTTHHTPLLCHFMILQYLSRDSVTRFFASCSFRESVSPQPQSIPLRPFQFFQKFAEIFTAQGLPLEKIFNQKNFNNFVWSPLGNRGNIYINFCLQVHFQVSAA